MPQPTFTPAAGVLQPASSTAVPPLAQLTVKDWCNKHNLGDDESQGLSKLGFRVGAGNKLDNIPKEHWEWAGLGPLHQQRILTAYNAERGL